VLVAVMGFARIYAGHHWASDVIAGALLGSLWLAIAIRIYCWGRSGTIARSSLMVLRRQLCISGKRTLTSKLRNYWSSKVAKPQGFVQVPNPDGDHLGAQLEVSLHPQKQICLPGHTRQITANSDTPPETVPPHARPVTELPVGRVSIGHCL
jgi:hypothetical protein